MFRRSTQVVLCVALWTLVVPAVPAEAQEAPAASAEVAALLTALSASDAAVRIQAVRALGALGVPATEPALTQSLRFDPVPEVRGWAARSLMELGSDTARAAVSEAARSDAHERRAVLTQIQTG